MTQITVRISDTELEKEIRRRSKESGKSLNKVALELIRGGAGLPGEKAARPGASLAKFAGRWTDKDAAEFDEAIRIFEQIDEEMWK